MAYSNYRFTLDVQRNVSQVSLSVRQHDTNRSLAINLTDGGTPYKIEDGCVAVFAARRSDQTPIDAYCIIENNTTIRYDLQSRDTSEVGVVDCEIRLYDIDGRLITSPRFIIVVDSRVYANDEIIPEDEGRSVLDEIYGSEAARKANEAKRISAEEARKVADIERGEAVRELIANANTALDEAIQNANNDLTLAVSTANKAVSEAISNANASVNAVINNANASVSEITTNANNALQTAEETLKTANEAASKVNMEQIVQNVLDELPVWEGGSY